MAGFFKRVSRITMGKINAFLDGAEKPEEVLPMLLEELRQEHKKAIEAEARRLCRALGTHKGGFIGYVEEYSVMGMPEVNYRACARAFSNLKKVTMCSFPLHRLHHFQLFPSSHVKRS